MHRPAAYLPQQFMATDPPPNPTPLDTLILGGEVAGLWLLDTLRRAGHRVVLGDTAPLGTGQTVCAQGIIHGGLKYSLKGMITDSARVIASMPPHWADCLAGAQQPDLSAVRVRDGFCYLWRTDAIKSRIGLFGASKVLRARPEAIDKKDWPPALHQCPGEVYRVNEQVIDPCSLLSVLLERNSDHVVALDADEPIAVASHNADGARLTLRSSTGQSQAVDARRVVLTAGAGNASLRDLFGLQSPQMQRRPLHMPMVKMIKTVGGDLPRLSGHCADGARTRITVTWDTASDGQTVWQVGGQVAEDGVDQPPDELLPKARAEVAACIPGLDLSNTVWAAYRVDRAEPANVKGIRPDDAFAQQDGCVVTAWPTKLALAPRLAETVAAQLAKPTEHAPALNEFKDWPRPGIALPPWETVSDWSTLDRA